MPGRQEDRSFTLSAVKPAQRLTSQTTFKKRKPFQLPLQLHDLGGILYSPGVLCNSYDLYCSHTSISFKPPNAADSNFTISNVPQRFLKRLSSVSSADLWFSCNCKRSNRASNPQWVQALFKTKSQALLMPCSLK